MAIATVLSYSPSESRIIIDEVISAASLTSVINITKGTQLYTIGKDGLISFNVIDNNSVITLSADTSTDSSEDIISVRYQGPPPWENVNYLRKDDLLLDNLSNISTLPNNTKINEVEHFYQVTKPITRGDGSPLVVGDRWWYVNDGTEWFWNGTYWLSSKKFIDLKNYFTGSSQVTMGSPGTGTILVHSFRTGIYTATQMSNVNYVVHRIERPGLSASISYKNIANPSWITQSLDINQIVDLSPPDYGQYNMWFRSTVYGSVSMQFVYCRIDFSLVFI